MHGKIRDCCYWLLYNVKLRYDGWRNLYLALSLVAVTVSGWRFVTNMRVRAGLAVEGTRHEKCIGSFIGILHTWDSSNTDCVEAARCDCAAVRRQVCAGFEILKIRVCWDVTLCLLALNDVSKDRTVFIFRVSQSKKSSHVRRSQTAIHYLVQDLSRRSVL